MAAGVFAQELAAGVDALLPLAPVEIEPAQQGLCRFFADIAVVAAPCVGAHKTDGLLKVFLYVAVAFAYGRAFGCLVALLPHAHYHAGIVGTKAVGLCK